MIPLIVLLFLGALAWAGWKLLRAYFVKFPFDNIPGPRRSSLLKGNFEDIFTRHALPFQDKLGEDYGQVVKIHGPLGSRLLFVFDPKALNHIITKDQRVYQEASWFRDHNLLIFGPGLFTTVGEYHRKQRKLLNPVFSINHMRSVTLVFYEVVHRLRAGLLAQVDRPLLGSEVDMLQWVNRTALEMIGQGGLGHSFDPLIGDSTSEFSAAMKEFSPTYLSLQAWSVFAPLALQIPPSVRHVLARWLPHGQFQKMRAISMTIDRHARQIFYNKREALVNGDEDMSPQIGAGKNILSVLVNANMTTSDEDKWPEEELIPQISEFIFAATDTTSNALARTLHLLSEHQDVQDKLRGELQDASHDDAVIPHDRLVELPYLDAVCRETLRLHAPVTFMEREVVADIVMPLGEPIKGVDGSMITEMPLPKGTSVVIGIRACNRNKSIWGEDALEWKPDRWLRPLPETVASAHIPGVYANLMTFLGGGKSCLGFKFAQLEMKVVLAVLLRSFHIAPSDKAIYWNFGGINYPTVGRVSTQPSMPVRLYLLDQ